VTPDLIAPALVHVAGKRAKSDSRKVVVAPEKPKRGTYAMFQPGIFIMGTGVL
jgi:hypothetical protein